MLPFLSLFFRQLYRIHVKIEDNNRIPLTYRQFLTRCFILGRQIKKQTAIGETVGVMMPTTIAGMVTFFALQAYRRIPAMLNFSMGFYNLYSACNTARIKSIYTARQFIETAKLEPLVSYSQMLCMGQIIH
ncbi:bifunctional protein Aas [Legionella pneumophila]|nr:bifunctional protein Aas [Legionella pneumophila]